MGNNKVDMTEVEEFSNNLGEASSDIRSQLEQVKESIESINGMSSFSGKTADEAKSYFEEMHLTIIESFRGLFDDLEGNLKQHIQDFQTKVDASESAKIESNYLKEVQEDIKEVYEDLESQEDVIAETIKEVSDITTADVPKFSEVSDAKDEAIEKTEEVEEDLESFNGTSEENDVEAILSQIESVMEKAQTSKGTARFSDFKGASGIKDLEKLQGYNEDKQEEHSETTTEITEDNIDDMSMDEIEEEKNEELSEIEEGSEDVLNAAFKDLKEGEIDKQTYSEILNGLKKFGVEAKEDYENIDIPQAIVDYLHDDSKDAYDASGEMTKHGITIGTFLKAHDLHRHGFEIEKYKTKNSGKVGYKIRNPELGGMPEAKKGRDTKIYYKQHIKEDAKKWKFGSKLPIADKVRMGSGSLSGLKTKAGWAGVALDVGLNAKDNIQDGESTQRIVGDASVDVGVGAISLAAAGAASAAVVGTAGLPVLAGAAAGIGASYAVSSVANFKVGDQSISEHAKDGVLGAAKGVKKGAKAVAGWFK